MRAIAKQRMMYGQQHCLFLILIQEAFKFFKESFAGLNATIVINYGVLVPVFYKPLTVYRYQDCVFA
jgi:hypothetical protein